MVQSNFLTQEQEQELKQRLTARQVAYMRMLEMPVETLRNRIEEELIDNAALERDEDASESITEDAGMQNDELASQQQDFAETTDQDTLDEIDYFESERRYAHNDIEEAIVFDDPEMTQFRDTLMRQISEYTLTSHQRTLLEYLIGSLDDDGLLKKRLSVIADELEIYRHITTNEDELKEVLNILQQFEPAGIGAQSLQETLQLQITRRMEEHRDSVLWPLLRRVITEQWDNLANNRWDRIRHKMKINDGEMRALQRMLRTLTPSPGCPPGEEVSPRNPSTAITPDFIVEMQDNGTIIVQLNEPGIPTLRINADFEALAQRKTKDESAKTGRSNAAQRDAQNYIRSRINRAASFIQNVQSRRETLLRVMREVAAAQRDYISTGDENMLHPLMMKDVATATDTDISIISRVAVSKWVETPFGMRPLRWFFRNQGGVVIDGVSLEQDRIKQALAEEIANEDKKHPLADEALAKVLQAKGYPVARRTVAKYREMLGIPVARLRQQR